jgi:sugar phosphate isomerase/epimerase
MENNFTRRSFIAKSALASIGASFTLNGFASENNYDGNQQSDAHLSGKISVFSKNLHWVSDYKELAEIVLALGFDGIDLTVRPGGHVLPENVKTDLPKAVEAIRKVGLDVYMITTSITDANHQHTETILKTAQSVGIKHYRTGWLNYDKRLSIPENLQKFKKAFNKLAVLNQKYGIKGNYQNHSGLNLGSCEIGLELLKSNIGTLDIKDFQWKNLDGKWVVENVQLGKGMVNFKKYFALLKQYQIDCPYSIHYEYPLGGAEDGSKIISIPKQAVLSAMKQDLDQLKAWLV